MSSHEKLLQATNAAQVGRQATILRLYRYDAAGQLGQIMDSRRSKLDYRYDQVGRLLRATGGYTEQTEHFVSKNEYSVNLNE